MEREKSQSVPFRSAPWTFSAQSRGLTQPGDVGRWG